MFEVLVTFVLLVPGMIPLNTPVSLRISNVSQTSTKRTRYFHMWSHKPLSNGCEPLN